MNQPIPPRPDLPGPSVPLATAGRPPTSWGPLEAVGLYLVANLLIAQMLVGGILVAALGIRDVTGGADAELLLVSAVAAVVSLTALWLWLRSRHPEWRAMMGLDAGAGWLADARWGAVAGLILYPTIALGVATGVAVLLEVFFDGGVRVPDQLAPDLSVAGRVLAVAYGIAIAPVAEEFFFRGVLFRSIADRSGFWVGAIVSGAVFGLVHWPVGEVLGDALVLPIVMTFTGIGLAWIYERRQRLIAPIAAHMVFNAIGLVLIFSGVGG